MGDIADYLYERDEEFQLEIGYQIQHNLDKSNNELVELCKDSQKALIQGICNYFKQYSSLSDKQRYVLAKHIAEKLTICRL